MEEIEVIKSWEVGAWFSTCKYQYATIENYVTNIQPMDGSRLKINGRDWLDCYNKKFTLESFQTMALMMGTKPTVVID